MSKTSAPLINPVLIAACIIIMIGFAIRASFGVFQIPIASEFGWLRTEFSMAIAIQNLAWGIGQPIFGAIAEKFGDRIAIVLGVAAYATGLILSSFAITPEQHQLLEIIVGFGIAGTGFGVILAVVGRAASEENRSLALGIATAAGSMGQVIGPPVAAALLDVMRWSDVFLVFAGCILLVLLLLPMLRSPQQGDPAALEESMSKILFLAFRDPSYTLIFLGFFSCGFQLGFITAHFPAFVTEACGPIAQDGILAAIGVTSTSTLGALAIGMIGFANIFGTIAAGLLGKHYSKKYLLAGLYTARTIITLLFVLNPITPISVVLFSFAMGLTWLATVPLTSGLVAHIYGIRFMGTLYGIVFLSHQIGGFLGVYLGGSLFDLYGSYSVVWWVSIAVGAFSALVHLPVRERVLVGSAA